MITATVTRPVGWERTTKPTLALSPLRYARTSLDCSTVIAGNCYGICNLQTEHIYFNKQVAHYCIRWQGKYIIISSVAED